MDFLKPHLTDAAKYDTNSPITIVTAFHRLAQTLLEIFVEEPFTITQVVTFLQRLLEAIPSSSSPVPTSKPRPEFVIGEHLVDVFWAVEMQVEEHLNAAKAALAATDSERPDMRRSEGSKEDAFPGTFKERHSGPSVPPEERKRRAEVSRDVLYDFLRQLLVRPNRCFYHTTIETLCVAQTHRRRSSVSRTTGHINPLLHWLDCRWKCHGEKGNSNADWIIVRSTFETFAPIEVHRSYKQNKFNLLREESEGYTKLSTELMQSIGPPHSSVTALPTESEVTIDSRARAAWDKIVGLIGHFDLDPNRALDITLDVLSTHITAHYSFFLALLRASTWHRTPLLEKTSSMDVDEAGQSPYRGKTLDQVLTMAEIGSTTPDQFKNAGKAQVCAEVLGFKFAHYQVGFK